MIPILLKVVATLTNRIVYPKCGHLQSCSPMSKSTKVRYDRCGHMFLKEHYKDPSGFWKSRFPLWILGSLDGQMTLGSVKRSSIGAMVIMTGNNFRSWPHNILIIHSFLTIPLMGNPERMAQRAKKRDGSKCLDITLFSPQCKHHPRNGLNIGTFERIIKLQA